MTILHLLGTTIDGQFRAATPVCSRPGSMRRMLRVHAQWPCGCAHANHVAHINHLQLWAAKSCLPACVFAQQAQQPNRLTKARFEIQVDKRLLIRRDSASTTLLMALIVLGEGIDGQ